MQAQYILSGIVSHMFIWSWVYKESFWKSAFLKYVFEACASV